MAGLGEVLKYSNAYYHDGAAVPQNTSANGTSLRTSIGGIHGAQQVEIELMTALALADTKVLTIKVQDSADNSTFADVETIYSLTAAGGSGAIAAGTILERYVLPDDIREYTRVVLTTDDAAVTGSVDVYLKYLPR